MATNDLAQFFAAPFGWGAWVILALVAVQWVWKRLGAGGDGYASKKGELLATKEDLDNAVKQLTALEGVRIDAAHKDWVAREWKAVRIRNLEVMSDRAFQHYVFTHQVARYHFLGESERERMAGFDPFDYGTIIRLMAIQKLYYPEIRQEVQRFAQACKALQEASQEFFNTADSEHDAESRRQQLANGWMQMDFDAQFAHEAITDALAALAKELFSSQPDSGAQR